MLDSQPISTIINGGIVSVYCWERVTVMSETVLVTGGAGYVAGWCIFQLLEAGYTVRTTVRARSKADQLRPALPDKLATSDDLSFMVADLTAVDGWAEAMKGCDYVLHVASPLGITHSNDPQELIN